MLCLHCLLCAWRWLVVLSAVGSVLSLLGVLGGYALSCSRWGWSVRCRRSLCRCVVFCIVGTYGRLLAHERRCFLFVLSSFAR